MSKHIIPFIAALVVPLLIFILVVGMNDSDLELDFSAEKQVNFDVQNQKQLKQPKPKPKPKPKREQVKQDLPAIKPVNIGSTLSPGGLSFGVPQFDEATFAELGDGGLLDSFANTVMDKGSVDTAPKVVRRSPIVYPELARRQGISGYVAMNVLINETGDVEEVEILDSKPKEIFDLKADSTIRRWKFEPATYNGKKVKVWAMQKIVFKLD